MHKSFLCGMKYSLLFLTAISTALFTIAQDAPQPPYKRFPSVPPFKILLTDSSTYFTKENLDKKKSVMFMLFSPDCEHCQHEMEEIIKNIKSFDKTQLVLSTTRDFDQMREFYQQYGLDRFGNIIVGKDEAYMLPVFFGIHNLPFLAFYNRKKELISVFSGAMPIEKVIEELKK